LLAQTGITNASVSGMVKDKITGKPMENYTVETSVNVTWVGDTVLQNSRSKDVSVTTDSSGSYKLADLPPGSYRISARNAGHFGGEVTRHVAVNGSDVEHIDFLVTAAGTISGKVVDENKEPVPDVTVRLVKREYYLGNPGYYYASAGENTNDSGEFTISGVEPGLPYFLMVEKLERTLPAQSEVPRDPKLRRRTPVRTWYPNSPSRDAAQTIVLQPGEKREGVDIELRKGPSYCVEGKATGPMGPAKLNFGIEATQPSMGVSSTGGFVGMPPSGFTAADGQFRICDLYPGVYRLLADDANARPPLYSATEIAIADQDLHGVTVAAVPGNTLQGEVAWDADPPATPVTNKVSLALFPLFRPNFQGEQAFARADIPGAFTIEGAFPEDTYAVHAFFYAPAMYVKDVTFSGNSVMYAPFRPGAAMSGAGFRVIMAHDGATLNVQVNDKDGNPGVDLRVLVIPADTRSEGELAARLVNGQTNQLGQYTTQTLPPGKYYVVATEESVYPTPESIGRLWRSRNRYQEVDLPPAGVAQLRLEPGKIE
jgi:protocatechuate 3,4-dioxygenase beta subunit